VPTHEQDQQPKVRSRDGAVLQHSVSLYMRQRPALENPTPRDMKFATHLGMLPT
jgi:hypothetical protein